MMEKQVISERDKATQKLMRAVIIVAIAFVVLLAGFYVATATTPVGKQVTSLSELGGDFTLQSKHGAVSLSDFAGKVVVLYFGYMTCPDVCPTSMSTIKKSIQKLSQAQAQQVQGLLVSVDPQRDSLEELHDYTQYFHKNLLGVTGTVEQVKQVAQQYGAYYDYIDDPEEGYLVEHVSRYFVINQQGVLIDAMRHGTSVNELAARLSSIL